jgi:tRNA-Thr(GGU) m(6)t(6)A37 methyltransferase TsaA
MEIEPIGVIHSPFQEASGTPIQPFCAAGATGTVEVFPPFVEGLKDLAGFDRIWLLFWCHRSSQPKLTVTPYRDTQAHGVFATRAPARPNPIGMSAVRLNSIDGAILQVAEIDILDNTPLLDIKPYVREYDHLPAERCGWLDAQPAKPTRIAADGRFEQP